MARRSSGPQGGARPSGGVRIRASHQRLDLCAAPAREVLGGTAPATDGCDTELPAPSARHGAGTVGWQRGRGNECKKMEGKRRSVRPVFFALCTVHSCGTTMKKTRTWQSRYRSPPNAPQWCSGAPVLRLSGPAQRAPAPANAPPPLQGPRAPALVRQEEKTVWQSLCHAQRGATASRQP